MRHALAEHFPERYAEGRETDIFERDGNKVIGIFIKRRKKVRDFLDELS
jgi:hypothetical protein